MFILETALSPIVWLMKLLLDFYVGIFSSTGFSILLLSFSFALLLVPLQRMALRTEQRVGSKINTVEAEVEPLKVELKGEALFLATEKVYKKHGYHPIQSIALGASFFVMLPVLVSAILLLTGDQLAGIRFMFIKDLSMPDGLLGPVNLLPLLMSAITVVDARLRFKDDLKSQYRFFFIAFVLLILVYNLAAGLVLYWTGSNILSLVVNRIKSR
jgi:membrane protein insertase Oxa1/YidC/SpoIIIJ